MKKLANALLTIFGSIHSCESMNFVKSSNRNKLSNELTEKCVKRINTEYENNIKKLAETDQPIFIETTGIVTHELML